MDCFVVPLLAMTEEKKDAPRNDGEKGGKGGFQPDKSTTACISGGRGISNRIIRFVFG